MSDVDAGKRGVGMVVEGQFEGEGDGGRAARGARRGDRSDHLNFVSPEAGQLI